MLPISCHDVCPVCGTDLKYDGWPLQHQHDGTGETCSYQWDYEGALAAEADADFESEGDW